MHLLNYKRKGIPIRVSGWKGGADMQFFRSIHRVSEDGSLQRLCRLNHACRILSEKFSSPHIPGRLLSVVLMISLLLPFVSASDLTAALVPNATVVVSTTLNVRSDPSSDGYTNVIDSLANGQRVMVGGTVANTGSDSNTWCSITYTKDGVTEKAGYVVYSYLALDPVSADSAFESSIAGFPESYKPSLRVLHQKYPKWIFNPVTVGTDWNTVVSEESRIGRSLIPSSVDDAWKSTDSGTYNWLTNTYTVYDGTSWVNASTNIVAYYLDPRNFLGETYVFQFLNLAYDANTQTADAVQRQLSNTFMASGTITDMNGNQQTYAQAFMLAAGASGASPYQLVSRVIQEVSSSGSRSTSGTVAGYEGLYNYYNIGAGSSSDPVLLGLTFAKCGSSNIQHPMSAADQAKYYIPWNSPYKSLLGGAVFLSENYIQKGQNTAYFQKFDVTDGGNGMYWHQYMTNIQAMTGESATLYNAYLKSGLLDLPLIFNIPVYGNMPESPAAQPAKTGNPNNYLSALSVNGYTLTPTFDPSVTDGYSLIVPYQVGIINLSASTVSSAAAVSGTGDIVLQVGSNAVAVSVTAQNGSVRSYNINIVRNEQTGTDLFATSYRINADNTLGGITPGTTVSGMSAGITFLNGGQAVFLNSAGAQITDMNHCIATGDHLQILNASSVPVYDYSLIVYGDANRDGKISSSDLTVICRQVLKEAALDSMASLAADANHDGKVSSSDLTVICRHVLKESTITQ